MFEMLESTAVPSALLRNLADVHGQAGMMDGDIPATVLAMVAAVVLGHLAIRRISGMRPGAAA